MYIHCFYLDVHLLLDESILSTSTRDATPLADDPILSTSTSDIGSTSQSLTCTPTPTTPVKGKYSQYFGNSNYIFCVP